MFVLTNVPPVAAIPIMSADQDELNHQICEYTHTGFDTINILLVEKV